MTHRFYGKIEGIKYTPTFKLPTLQTYRNLAKGIKNASSFIYVKGDSNYAVSWWVSPKRTRSYPYARVYNTLQFTKGKVVTIIPVMKDEGIEGDRDFIQWDTVSLMSLLNVYVIIGYYKTARKKPGFENKVTSQEFDYEYLDKKFDELSNYRSDALHWNIEQLSNLSQIAEKALESYKEISQQLGVKFHDLNKARERINKVFNDVQKFKDFSRKLSFEAQRRETQTKQPKEKTFGEKGSIDIVNSLGGLYHFTIDEVFLNLEESKACLIEAKHTSKSALPSEDDIKDGLIKMILYTNLKELYYVTGQDKVKINEVRPILRLTNNGVNLEKNDYDILRNLLDEAKQNNFTILLNQKVIKEEEGMIKFRDFVC